MRSKGFKITLGTYFVLLAVVLLQLRNSAPAGYELSLYTNTLPLTWFLILPSIAAGIAIIVHQAWLKSQSHWWLAGFGLILIGNFMVTSLPGLRGYYLSALGDPSAHLGYAKDILLTGHLSQLDQNFYPFIHILMVYLAQIGNISLETVANYLPAIISSFFMVYLYLLATLVFQRRELTLLTAAAAALLFAGLFHIAIYPQGMAYLTLPLLFYLYFKTRQVTSAAYRVPFVLLLLAYPFWHPHTAVMVVLFLIAMEIARAAYGAPWQNQGQMGLSLRASLRDIATGPILISFITLFTWFSAFSLFGVKVRQMYLVLMGEESLKSYHLQKGLSALQLEGMDVVYFFLKTYGHFLIYGVLSLIAVAIILRQIRRRDDESKYPFFLIIWAVVGEAASLAFFYLAKTQTPTRLAMADNAALLSPLLVAFTLSYLRRWQPWRKGLGIGLTVAIIAGTSFLPIFSIYRSPYIYQTNNQATRMDIAAFDWLIQKKNRDTVITGLGFNFVYPAIIMGLDEVHRREDIERSVMVMYALYLVELPSHFKYDEGLDSLGGTFAYDKYIVLTERFRAVFADPGLRRNRVVQTPSVDRWDFKEEDFQQLARDPALSQVYSNGDVGIFLQTGGAYDQKPQKYILPPE